MAMIQNEIKDIVITNLLNRVINQDKLISYLKTECEILKVNLLDTLKLLLTRNTMIQVKQSTTLSSPRRRSKEHLNSVFLNQGLSSPSRQKLHSNDLLQSNDSFNKKNIDLQAGDMLKSLSVRNEQLSINTENGKLPRELISKANHIRIWNYQTKNSSLNKLNEKKEKIRSYSSAKKEESRNKNKIKSFMFQRNKNDQFGDGIHTPNRQRKFNGYTMSSYQTKFNGKLLNKI